MKKHFIPALVLISFIFMLNSCSRQNAQPMQEVTPKQETPTPVRVPREREELVPVGQLEGEINILIPPSGYDFAKVEEGTDLSIYARLFQELHPNVQINFDVYDNVNDMAQQTALTTRLLSDPPDLFYVNSVGGREWGGGVSFEKTEQDALFADLYDFFYGPRGIDQSKYFTNIFRAAEVQGGLYHLPLSVDFEMSFLNRRLFEGIGEDWSKISSLTMDEVIDYFKRVSEAFPDESLWPYRRFSVWDILTRENLYDIETGKVSVDTPQFRELLEQAMKVYRADDNYARFTPEGPELHGTAMSPGMFSHTVLSPQSDMNQYMLWFSSEGGTAAIATILFLAEHPNMQFSQPLFLASGDGSSFGFNTSESLAIMQNAANKDLAWEFLRFIMEYEENLFEREPAGGSFINNFQGYTSIPINRARFENQYSAYMDFTYDMAVMFTDLEKYIDLPEEEQKDQTAAAMFLYRESLKKLYKEKRVASVMDFYREATERLNYEIRFDNAVFHSLVYPEFWLLYSGQQDLDRTLANIQNRLELYVKE